MFNSNLVYIIVFVASALGFGAGRYLPQNSDLERQLHEAHRQLEELREKCERPALSRVPIKRPLAGKDF